MDNLVTETFSYDGGRQVAVYVPSSPPEAVVYAGDGQPRSSSLLDYLVPVACDVPPVELHHLSSPSPRTTLGSKGVGEAGTIGALGAVANAVADAVAPLGAELTALPYGPERIFQAIRSGQKKAPPRG